MTKKLALINEKDKILGFKKQLRIFRNHIFRSRAELMMIRFELKKKPLSIEKYLNEKRLFDLEHKIYKQELCVNVIEEVIGKVLKTLNLDVRVDFVIK